MSDAQDQVVEVTRTGWLRRVAGSFAGVLVGFVLVFVSVGVLFWNEGRAVTTARSLGEGRAAVVPITPNRVDLANEARLVYATGPVTVSAPLADPAFGISATGLRLVRVAEMFQWREESRSETRKTLGGGEETVTTYSYSTGWEPRAVDSARFHAPAGHQNPPMPVEGTAFQVPEAGFGAFTLGPSTLDAVPDGAALPIGAEQRDAVAAAAGDLGRPLHVAAGRLLFAADPGQPAIGDLRVSYTLAPAETLSLVARQTGTTFGAYQTAAGDRIQLVETGQVSAEDLFAHAETENMVLTWVVRGVTLLVLFVGFALVSAPLAVIADVVPFFGGLVGLGTMLFAFAATLLVGGGTIALAWLFFRPLVALAVAAVAGLLVAGILAARRRATPRPA